MRINKAIKKAFKEVLLWESAFTEKAGARDFPLLAFRRTMRDGLQKYLKWNSGFSMDTEMRYEEAKRAYDQYSTKTGKVLDVGCSNESIGKVLKRQVVGLDLKYEGEPDPFLTPVIGSGTAIPFKDREFEDVFCIDSLEHFPRKDRPLAIQEMIRVCNSYYFLVVPCGKMTSKAEKAANNMYNFWRGYDHPILKEHIDCGTPLEEEVRTAVTESGQGEIIFESGSYNLGLWFLRHIWRSPHLGQWTERFFNEVAYPFSKMIQVPPFYRRLFVIKRKN